MTESSRFAFLSEKLPRPFDAWSVRTLNIVSSTEVEEIREQEGERRERKSKVACSVCAEYGKTMARVQRWP